MVCKNTAGHNDSSTQRGRVVESMLWSTESKRRLPLSDILSKRIFVLIFSSRRPGLSTSGAVIVLQYCQDCRVIICVHIFFVLME